jgi:Asp-tRNA(Asn)/Glu-tRNA(Gln) amidotransferase B subunit
MFLTASPRIRGTERPEILVKPKTLETVQDKGRIGEVWEQAIKPNKEQVMVGKFAKMKKEADMIRASPRPIKKTRRRAEPDAMVQQRIISIQGVNNLISEGGGKNVGQKYILTSWG